MKKSTVGIGVSGLGFVGGSAHVPAFRKIPGSKLVAINDVIEEKTKKLKEKYDVKYYLDHMEMLEDPEIDAVVIAVPTPYHYKLASDAIAKGKHVFCEVPLTPTIAESRRLMEQAEKAGVILMPDLNFRFTPNYVKAKELIEQGAIGKPVAVTFREFISARDLAKQWPTGSWAWNVEKSGGLPNFTLSVWSIDLVRWLLDSDIVDVQWQTNYVPLVELDGYIGYNTMGVITFSTGAVGSLHYGTTVTQKESTSVLEVFGDNSNILRAGWNDSLTLFSDSPPQTQIWVYVKKGSRVWGHYQIDEHFIQCIQGSKSKVSVEDAIKAQRIAEAMNRGQERIGKMTERERREWLNAVKANVY